MPPKVHEVVDEDIEEIEDEEDDEEMEEMDEGMDIMDALGGLFATEEGETLAVILSGVRDSLAKIAHNGEMQNKVLVKMLSVLSAKGS